LSYEIENALAAHEHEQGIKQSIVEGGKYTGNFELLSGRPPHLPTIYENVISNDHSLNWVNLHVKLLGNLDQLFGYMEKLGSGTNHVKMLGENYFSHIIVYAMEAIKAVVNDSDPKRELELLYEPVISGIERLEDVAMKYAEKIGSEEQAAKDVAEQRRTLVQKQKSRACEFQDVLYAVAEQVAERGDAEKYAVHIAQYARLSRKFAQEVEEDDDSFAGSILGLDNAAKEKLSKEQRKSAVSEAYKIWGADVPDSIRKRFD
jgi:hypothetical protein